ASLHGPPDIRRDGGSAWVRRRDSRGEGEESDRGGGAPDGSRGNSPVNRGDGDFQGGVREGGPRYGAHGVRRSFVADESSHAAAERVGGFAVEGVLRARIGRVCAGQRTGTLRGGEVADARKAP